MWAGRRERGGASGAALGGAVLGGAGRTGGAGRVWLLGFGGWGSARAPELGSAAGP
ncbi:hypothetical protein GCM10009804_07990 [Kribbella hippodromi]|uniref:Uncharacterized protein n=1 Tax=Kribbella hippodromi TaxID=434347 RepID=A0ABP4N504_9ACTN